MGLGVLVAYVGGTFALAHGSLYAQSLVLTAAVFGILALSLDIVTGMTGLYSLGHAAMFALAAYATAILNADDHIGIWLLLPIAVFGVGAVGAGIGLLSLRVSGLYFAVTTFVLTLVISTVAGQLNFAGGPQGMIGPLFPSFAASVANVLGSSVVWCIMLALLLTIVLVWCIRHSPAYPVLLALRDAEPLAAAVGVRTSLTKVVVIGFSGALCGLAGWAFSFLGIVSPSQFTWSVSVNILVMVLLGGINTIIGPLIGAAIISIYPAYVNINPLWQECLIAAVFVAVVVLAPTGIVGVVRNLFEATLHRLRKTEPVTPSSGQTVVEASATATEEQEPQPAQRHRHVEGWEVEASGDDEFAVECEGIDFDYISGVTVLKDVDFKVKRGTIHGLIGPNGSGKSTLVNLIAGVRKPLAGTIKLHGNQVERLGPDARARGGVMRTFQTATLVNDLTARENVTLGLYTKIPRIVLRAPVWPAILKARREHRWMREQSSATLEWVGAGAWDDLPAGRAPHGVRQLAQIAAASVARPRLLILDEPFPGLTTGEVENLSNLLRELREIGVSVILIEHQTRVLFALCDEVTVLNAGGVVATGSAAEVFQDERVREVYLGQ